MLELFTWFVERVSDLLFWLENKEQDAAVMRIKNINKAITRCYNTIKKLEDAREEINKKYFSEGE
jgi:hypothetical protein